MKKEIQSTEELDVRDSINHLISAEGSEWARIAVGKILRMTAVAHMKEMNPAADREHLRKLVDAESDKPLWKITELMFAKIVTDELVKHCLKLAADGNGVKVMIIQKGGPCN